MEEKKPIKISLSTFFLILAIIIIAIMGYFLYEIYDEKLVNENNIVKLNSEISNLKSEISNMNNKEDDTTNKENDSPEDTVNTNFYGVYTSADKIYKFVFLPNGEMCYINKNSSDYKVMPGTYNIKDNILYYSTSRMIEWFEGGTQTSYFEIVDRNTLKYNNTNYVRAVEEKLNGTYNTSDASLILDNNGSFELSSYGEENQKGKYVINNDILKLNNESEENNDGTGLAQWLRDLSNTEEERMEKFGH